MQVSDLTDFLVGLGVSKPGRYELVTPFEARYAFGDGSIQCCVDVQNGKVFKLIATNNYSGTFDAKIRIGMLVQEAIQVDQRLYYDEAEEGLLCKGTQGIRFDLPIVDPLPSEVASLRIAAIVVYATESQTEQGQAGRW
jgi:hypothetical protein